MPDSTCRLCSRSGYGFNGAVMLSPGYRECTSCDGFNTPPHGSCPCDASDASDHECGEPCPDCDEGVVLCDHPDAPRCVECDGLQDDRSLRHASRVCSSCSRGHVPEGSRYSDVGGDE